MLYSDQKKRMFLAFAAVMFITPDSLFIRLANLTSWNLIFYRGFIPFLVVFAGLLIIYKTKFISQLLENGWHGIAYASVFTITNIFFVISIENTNVANTLIMIALAPMLSAVISFIFLKENTDQKTWIAIIITTLAVIYIFNDSFERGDLLGNFLGLICATGLAVGAVIIRSAKKIKELQQFVKKNYLKSSTLIYKKDSKENYLVVCKKQTCSNKIKNIEELKSIVKNYAI